MDPQSYQQMMVQQLMGANQAAPGMTGQNASTPYGAAFVTGNQTAPQTQQHQYSPQTQQSANSPYGMLNQSANQVLQQPMAAY